MGLSCVFVEWKSKTKAQKFLGKKKKDAEEHDI